jgi:polar amino acid transport system substrate-binding protein
MALALMSGCSGGNKGKASASASDAEPFTFTVGFDAEFPPFGFIAEDGSYDGFDLALAKEVCRRLGWTFVAQPISWDAKDSELESGNIDCIWNGFTKSEDRLDKYAWTDAYYDNSIVAVVRADSGIKTLADLAGKNVMVQAGSSGLSALEENEALKSSFGQLLECADYNSAFMELDQGTVDAVVADVGVANYNMASKKGDYAILDEAVSSEVYAIGFLLGNDELAAKVWSAVLEIAEDGTMEKIADEYVDDGLVKESLCLIY